MPSVYEILLESFLSSIWLSELSVLTDNLPSEVHHYTWPWQRLQKADVHPLPSGRVNSPTHTFSTMAWSLGSSIGDELVWKASQKANAATLTVRVKFLHGCRLQRSLNEGEEQQDRSQTHQKLQDTQPSVLNWRPSPGPWSQLRDEWGSVCSKLPQMTSLLPRWH